MVNVLLCSCDCCSIIEGVCAGFRVYDLLKACWNWMFEDCSNLGFCFGCGFSF